MLHNILPDMEKLEAKLRRIVPSGYMLALNIRHLTPEFLQSTYPPDWIEIYTERRYVMFDPIVTWARFAEYLRRAEAGDPAPMSEAEQQRFVAQIDKSLTPDAVAALRAGNAEVLDKFSQDPLRQLELAKAYLESSEVTAHGPAMERVLDALAEEQIEAQRARHVVAHGEKGITHG